MTLPKLLKRIVPDSGNPGESSAECSGLRIQTGALPWRITPAEKPEVLLVTGRRSGRWMIPKGWPMPGKSLAKAAEREAYEEAGVEGAVGATPIGQFDHVKQSSPLGPLKVRILVHHLVVERELAQWPEHGQRQRTWFSLEEAAQKVDSRELGAMILQLRGIAASDPKAPDQP
jgi:8-oxo-dGTP pyrophosphatase MutT (NUDIX family)